MLTHTHMNYMTNSQTYQLSTEGKAIFYKKEIWNTKQVCVAVIPQNFPWKGCHILRYPYTEEGEYRSEWPRSRKIFFIEINTHRRQSTIKEVLKIQEGRAHSCPPASVHAILVFAHFSQEEVAMVGSWRCWLVPTAWSHYLPSWPSYYPNDLPATETKLSSLSRCHPSQERTAFSAAYPVFTLTKNNMYYRSRASLVAQRLKRLPAMQGTWVQSLGQEDPLEKELATHSSILAWRIPWTEEPGGLQSTGLQRVGHDWATSLSLDTGALQATVPWPALPSKAS